MNKMLNTITLGIAALLMGCNAPVEKPDNGKQPTDNDTTAKVATYITTADGTMRFTAVAREYAEGLNMSPEKTLTFNPQKRYQQFDGFGAAITGATAFNLMQMPEYRRQQLLQETFSVEEGMGYSYVRVPIGGSDFNSRSNYDYTCCDQEGIENFALQSDEVDYIIPVLKQILAINPDLKVMGTPWSCPTWMKVDDINTKAPYSGQNKWVGGYLNPDYYNDYATYFVKWIKAFEAEGIQITSVTPQNEPLNWGNSMSLYMPWDQERDFVKTALGPTFKREGIDTKIICFDHNYNYDNMEEQFRYPVRIYEDADASRYISGAAYHNYGGNRKELLEIHKLAPEKELVFSEASIGEWNNGREMEKSLLRDMDELTIGTVNNWCKAVILWNLMLDTKQGPHGGPGACSVCYGAVDIDPETYSVITRNSHYYVIAHMGAVVKPGAVRIQSKGDIPQEISYSAFENPDGSYALVVCNKGKNELLSVNDGKRCFTYQIPAKAIVSFTWK